MQTNLTDDSLFISKIDYYRDVEKIAEVTLSRDGDDWEQTISQALHKEHPFIQEHNIKINLVKIDPEHGVGVGSVHIDDKVSIPIIIEKFKLAPLDVFWHDKQPSPLTRTSIESALQETELGKPVTPGRGEQTDVSLYSRTQPPFDGKYTYAQLNVVSPKLLGLRLVSELQETGLQYELQKNATFRGAVSGLLREGNHEKVASSTTALRKVKLRTIRPFSKLASSGVYELSHRGSPTPAVVFDTVFKADGTVSESGTGLAVSLSKEASWSYIHANADIGGRSVSKQTKVASNQDIRSGSSGVFGTFGKIATCTEPLTVECAIGTDSWIMSSYLGDKVRLVKSAEVISPKALNGHLYIPDSWTWIPTGKTTRFSNTKTANAIQASSPNDFARIEKIGGGYLLTGDLAFSGEPVSEYVLHDYLSKEVGETTATTILKTAAHTPVCLDVSESPTQETQYSPELGKVNLVKESTYITPCREFVSPYFDGSIKVAAVSEDEARQTVDALLGLNFLNSESLFKFVEKVELIKEAKVTVARLLLASRLGLDVDSRPLRTAMFSLDSVERDLRELQNATEIEERES
jgi:hypothetical protein